MASSTVRAERPNRGYPFSWRTLTRIPQSQSRFRRQSLVISRDGFLSDQFALGEDVAERCARQVGTHDVVVGVDRVLADGSMHWHAEVAVPHRQLRVIA